MLFKLMVIVYEPSYTAMNYISRNMSRSSSELLENLISTSDVREEGLVLGGECAHSKRKELQKLLQKSLELHR